jgi:hypothetical protein
MRFRSRNTLVSEPIMFVRVAALLQRGQCQLTIPSLNLRLSRDQSPSGLAYLIEFLSGLTVARQKQGKTLRYAILVSYDFPI